jgi:hypothetical protein
MKEILVAVALTLMCGSAFAQTATGPAGQSDMNKPGMTKGAMDNGSMDKDSMNKGTATGMGQDGMAAKGMNKKDISKDGSPSANTMKKDAMSKSSNSLRSDLQITATPGDGGGVLIEIGRAGRFARYAAMNIRVALSITSPMRSAEGAGAA